MSNLTDIATASLQETLSNYWKETLNIEKAEPDANFFDLGGSSLQAIKMISRFNREHGFKLPISIIYQLPTIRQLAHKIENTDTEELKPIILLKEGEGVPLFIFPPWSSYPTIFNEFVETFKGNNPLYGVIYTEDSDDFPFKDLQEYASFIASHIKKLQPDGNCGLLGCSMGARTILEVAIQLRKGHSKVSFLGAVSHYPSYPPKRPLLNRRVLDEIRIFTNLKLQFRIKYLRHRLPYFLKLLLTGDNSVQEVVIENGAQGQILAIHEGYQPNSKYDGDLLLIYETSPEGTPSELKKAQVYRNSIFELLWRQYVKGNIIVKIVECRHNDFFKKPAVFKITEIVESYLQ